MDRKRNRQKGDAFGCDKMTRIIYADDEEELRETMPQILRRKGYCVDICTNGVEAVNAVTEGGYDLALLDNNMGGGKKDGVYAAREMKRRKPGISVILISGLPSNEIGKAVEEKAVDYFLEKPFGPDELIDAVEKCLKAEKT